MSTIEEGGEAQPPKRLMRYDLTWWSRQAKASAHLNEVQLDHLHNFTVLPVLGDGRGLRREILRHYFSGKMQSDGRIVVYLGRSAETDRHELTYTKN